METFTSQELDNLQSLFNNFALDGNIPKQDIPKLLQQLTQPRIPDLEAIQILLEDLSSDQLPFQDFLAVVSRLEHSGLIQPSSSAIQEVTGTQKLLDVLKQSLRRLLQDYRQECEEQGKYAEANRAKAKHDQLKKKEISRQLKAIRVAQEDDLHNLDQSHQVQFAEFTDAWDKYMAEYESTAYASLQKLKEKHMIEYQQFHEKVLKEIRGRMKPSKELLALRSKQQVMARQKLYDEAEVVKDRADRLEEWQRSKHEANAQEIVGKKELKIRKEQQQALGALMKRIQRDRNEQIKHRKEDSERLFQRNRNTRNDLIAKQNLNAKRLVEEVRRVFGLNHYDIKYQTKTGSFKLEKIKSKLEFK